MSAGLGDRTSYLGCSDLAAIIGASPYAAPIDVYRRIVDKIEPVQTRRMRMGQLLEEAIGTEYEETTGIKLRRRGEVVHPEYPYIRGHVDWITEGDVGVVDAKASEYPIGYGEPGTDQVPPHIRTQMVGYCGLLRREWADVALLRGTRGLDLYRVMADPELYAALIGEAVKFWTENVIPQIAPAVDGTEAYRDYLRELYPRDNGLEIVATPEQALLVEEWQAAQSASKAAKTHEELVKNRIRDVMGEAAVLLSAVGKVTNRIQKGSTYTVVREPGRVLRATFANAAEEAA